MTNKILFVDDEPNVLEGIQRTLRREYSVSIAEGGENGLSVLQAEGPFAVVVSDMRMPGMDGIQFLRRVRDYSPDTVKIMLTGNADQQTAMDAVNEGNIFRFLTKPCPPETLVKTLNAGLEQFRLATAEKYLLEQTLNQSLHVLVDILAIINPTAFGRSTRVKKLAREIADRLGVTNAWEVEIAAMLSQVGCVTVPEEILQKISNGAPLSNQETGLFHQHPQVGHDLIARIPRMENVAEIVASQNRRINDEILVVVEPEKIDEPTLGARILKVVLDYDKLIQAGNSSYLALKELSSRAGWYDPKIIEILQSVIEITAGEYVTIEASVSELKPGMILDKTLTSVRGSVLLSAGQEITMSLILRLKNLFETGIIGNKIQVNVPVEPVSALAE